MSTGCNRRDFSKAAVTAAAAGAATTLAPARVLGVGDQVRLGFIGVGNRGCQLLKAFLAQPDAKIVALCDVYAPYLNAEYDKVDPRFAGLGQRIPRMAALPGDVARVKDFRTVLDRPDIDAVVIATPDHCTPSRRSPRARPARMCTSRSPYRSRSRRGAPWSRRHAGTSASSRSALIGVHHECTCILPISFDQGCWERSLWRGPRIAATWPRRASATPP